jgi:hypothetical protein
VGASEPEGLGLHSGPVTLLILPSSPTSCFGAGSPQEEGLAWEEPATPPDVFSGPARCPAPYSFSFEMLVTGPCLLAGGYIWTGLTYSSQCSRLRNNPRFTMGGTKAKRKSGT